MFKTLYSKKKIKYLGQTDQNATHLQSKGSQRRGAHKRHKVQSPKYSEYQVWGSIWQSFFLFYCL